MRYFCTPIRVTLKTKKAMSIPSDVKDVEQLELSYFAGSNAKTV